MTGRSNFQVHPVSLMITWTDSVPLERIWLTQVAAICVFNPWTSFFFFFCLRVLNPSVAFLLFMRVLRIDCVRLTGS